MYMNNQLKELRERKSYFVTVANFANIVLKGNPSYRVANHYSLERDKAYNEIDSLNDKIDKICRDVQRCSYFDSEQIGPIISDLITVFEGEKFVYQSVHYYPAGKESELSKIKIIVLNDKKQSNWYDERYINSLLKKGNAIVLAKTPTLLTKHLKICFYVFDDMHRLNQNVSFGKFPYIKEFIDGVILYKMQNNIERITTDDLEKLKIDFISSRLDDIERNCQFNDERRLKEFLESLDHTKMVRKRKLTKILINDDYYRY